MNKKTINTIYKWIIRFWYFRIIVIGIGLICYGLTLLISDYKISNQPSLDNFIIFITCVMGFIFLIIGLFRKVETEIFIEEKGHEKD